MFARIRTLDILIGLVILLLVAGSFTVAVLRGQVTEEPGEDSHGHAHDAPAPEGESAAPYETGEPQARALAVTPGHDRGEASVGRALQ